MGVVNEVFESQEPLEAAIAQLAEQIAANSRAAIAAMRDMYAIAAQELGLVEGLSVENAQSYPAITDTNERLSGFG